MSQLDVARADHARDGLDHGMSLHRLLELTRPTPAQAVRVGLDVAGGVRARHVDGSAHGSLCPAEIWVGDDGHARLVGNGAGSRSGAVDELARRRRADLRALGGLLSELAAAARTAPSATAGGAQALLAALDAAVDHAALPGADIELVAGPLEVVSGPGLDPGVRSELAALVAAATASGWAPADRPAPAGRLAPPAPAQGSSCDSRLTRLGARLFHLWQRTWRWLVALVVLVGVVSLEFVLLQDRLTHDVHVLLGGGQPGQGSDVLLGPTTPALPRISAPAPASAETVRGVDLRALQACTPGAVCAVRTLVWLQPEAAPRVVSWSFQVVDRCTGSQHSVPGGAVSVPPGGDRALAVSTLPLPPGRVLGVTAVTSEPARAASRLLPVPVRQDSC